MTTLDELVAEKGWVIADGATGTNYFKLGLETGYPPELWNIERPDDVAGLHSAFIESGSQLVLTNSFGGTHHRLRLHGAQDRVTELNLAAARLARMAADAAKAHVMVAGSIGPTGELFAPMGALDYADARAAFTEQALALAEGGADMLWVETMSSLEEVRAAIDAAKTTGLPVAACMTFDTAARSMMGVMPAEFAGKAAEYGADLVGANCGIGPAELLHSVRGMLPVVDIPVIAKGNCGIPAYVDGGIHYHGTPELMADYACFARDAGITVIGGCCGTTPDHIAAMAAALESTPRRPFDPEAAEAALGKPWKDVPAAPEDKAPRRERSRRRRRD
ncbi:MAG: betaine--homocysteine S-methyltransferase [Pseudomonadota bacterium]|nr:betaine--homocysteine S-methyltransferase [Pseudomonadota bacterium]